MHVHMLVIGPKCSVSLCRSQLIACWEVRKMHVFQKAVWEKNMVGGSPMSRDLRKCSHKFVTNKLRWGLQGFRAESVVFKWMSVSLAGRTWRV